jgi:hypothetical protein
MTDEACVMSSEVLSALITLFAQGLNTEIVRYERLDEITPRKPITIPISLYRDGNGDDT